MSQIVPKEFLKHIFIGVDLDQEAGATLYKIAKMADGKLHNTSSDEIKNIFTKISLELGLQIENTAMILQNGDQTHLFAA